MFVVTHFSIPFFSYYTASHYQQTHDSKTSLLIYSSVVGFAGVLPDLTSIHISLAARHSSLSHTIWFPLLILLLTSIVVPRVKGLSDSLTFWLPFAVATHLFLDGISGGVRLFYPLQIIVGAYYISPQWWFMFEAFFAACLFVTFKYDG